ncbi:LON peptidase substrate-binding domain-containing protein [Luteithermobacter gelatinilyticus]|uniref:LON peptidase substrate-binding domain-containing protein n=1 Tax=Luteithermobacter gelatinilyticus TaxID=2582913 RepID=UPI00110673AB|nr:LON peptidase substrate-binding domain-containing protein [Luteithermobacter gelatinilyticus]
MFGLEELPKEIPVFPLAGVLLLPKGHLPLNIFEPRYLEMVRYAREGMGVIGMIQPLSVDQDARRQPLPADVRGAGVDNPPLYKVGCLGMISDYEETRDGRILIMLTGLSRYDIVEELPRRHMFREMRVDYRRFCHDCTAPYRSGDLDRKRLVENIEKYLSLRGICARWENFERVGDEELINALAMVCPFDAPEKQALLEAPTLKDRLDLMIRLMEFNLNSTTGDGDPYLH